MESTLKTTVKPEDQMNDVLSPDFVSKMDPKFNQQDKDKDHLQRQGSIKLWGKWT